MSARHQYSVLRAYFSLTYVVRFEPTPELALGVDQALRQRRDHKTDFVLFKLSWTLFVGAPWKDPSFIRMAEGAVGKSAALLCSLEESIRQETMSQERREGKRLLRSEFFQVMLHFALSPHQYSG